MSSESQVSRAQAETKMGTPSVWSAVGKEKHRVWLNHPSDSRLQPGMALLFMAGLSLVFWGGIVGATYLFWH